MTVTRRLVQRPPWWGAQASCRAYSQVQSLPLTGRRETKLRAPSRIMSRCLFRYSVRNEPGAPITSDSVSDGLAILS
jgi:hypothetical protein